MPNSIRDVNPAPRSRAVALAFLLFLSSTCLDCWAASKKSPTGKKDVLKAVATQAQDDVAKKRFETFAKDWMARLESINGQNLKNIKLANDPNGYSGRYICYGPECDLEVKPTASKEAPFIGILRYKERHMEKRGLTFSEATEAPSIVAVEVPVTEIFRYSKGKWVY